MGFTIHENTLKTSSDFSLFHCAGSKDIEATLGIGDERVVVRVVTEVVNESLLNRHPFYYD